MVYIGVDACKAGWFSVALEEGIDWKVDILSDISTFWNQYNHARLILIDIPIGLREKSSIKRLCDQGARDLLRPERHNSVFISPCRAAIYAKSYEEAKEVNKKGTDRKISRQVWGIIPKIKEVDVFLRENKSAMLNIRETHPEICFWALAGKRPMEYSKKKEEGIQERKKILASVYPHAEELFNYAEQRYLRKEVSRDDILDALVAAVMASKERQGLLTIPEKPEIDSRGLPMEIVYYSIPSTALPLSPMS